MLKHFLRNMLLTLLSLYIKFKPKIEKLTGEAILRTIPNRGVSCRLEGFGTVIDPQYLKLGDHVSIGKNFFIRATGRIVIGNYTHISRNVTIHTVNHNINGTKLPYDRSDIAKCIKIGQYVWIGMNASILPGVTIGDGAVVGMNTVVTKDIPPGEIVVGPPQRSVGARNRELEERLLADGSFLKN